MKIEKSRIGQFFLFIGLIMLVIFFATGQNESPSVGIFFAGLIIAGLGVYLIWRDWKPKPPSNRFRILRRKPPKKSENPENKG